MKRKNRQYRGITLIEVLIFTFMLSFLLTGFLKYAVELQIANSELFNEIINEQEK